jgi:uncharacterized membrane protein YfcA
VLVLGLILSLAIGVTLGLLGGGGSILTVPVLHYVFGLAAHDTVAMSLGIVGVTSLVALIPHARAGRVQWRVGLVFGAASMATAFLGARLGALLPGDVLISAFAALMVIAGAVMLVRARRSGEATTGSVRLWRVVAIGLVVGLVTGTLGAGGGFVILPALTLFGGLAMREAVATSLLIIALNSTAGLAGSLQHVSVDSRIALAVTGAAVIGSFIGARIARRVSTAQLQQLFGWFVIAVGVAILARELL